MDRRKFIKQGCFACMAVAGAATAATSLGGCSTLPIVRASVNKKNILVDTTLLPPEHKVVLLRNNTLEHDILLVKSDCGKYHALYMECTHNQNPLSPTSSVIYCNSHNAEFDLEGNVKAGPPKKNLKRFTAHEDQGIIRIDIS